jgi:hypothetical protein
MGMEVLEVFLTIVVTGQFLGLMHIPQQQVMEELHHLEFFKAVELELLVN